MHEKIRLGPIRISYLASVLGLALLAVRPAMAQTRYVVQDLGALPGFAHSFGWAINASGRATGSSTSASGNSERLIRFTDGSGLQDQGGTGEHNVGLGINAQGQVVGTRARTQRRALLYTDAAGLRDLNTLIDPLLGWVLLAANDINDAGQIVGDAFNNFTGQTHAVRLQPARRRRASQSPLREGINIPR